jgi:hypothetical protein
MSSPASRQRQMIEEKGEAVIQALKSLVARGDSLCVVKAPPGSGKTHTLLEAIGQGMENRQRIAVAAQTNSQCDDLCRRFAELYPDQNIWRFAAQGASRSGDLPEIATWVQATGDLPHQECVVVGTTAKWSLVRDLEPFDFLFVDEAWQMAWADFMLLSQVAPRFVLIGDPGQIPPVVSIPVERWETSPRAPHIPAPEIILRDETVKKLSLELQACRRLPAEGVEVIRPFYDFHFDAWAQPGERFLHVGSKPDGGDEVDPVLELVQHATSAILTLPTPEGGPPLEGDQEIARAAARVAIRALERKATFVADDDGGEQPLTPRDIGISSTHRVMNSAILASLPRGFRNQVDGIRVDTPERWQGLERKLMVLVHPLSGVVHPSAFDLETGRLCVMASRHRSAMIIVSRDHVIHTLDSHVPSAEQAVGRSDVTGRGHSQHSSFWKFHESHGQITNSGG